MNKTIFISFISLLISLFFYARPVRAKGTYDCVFRPQFGCRVLQDTCKEGYEPDVQRCSQYSQDRDSCNEQKNISCVSSVVLPLCEGEDGIDTAIGCIPISDTNSLIAFFLRWAIGIGGGIAFLLIVFAGFQITTSSGNPERLQAGRELLTSAIAGLIMLVFSVFVLRVIGIDILGLEMFGFGN